MVNEGDEAPVFHLEDLLRSALVSDVAEHDFAVVGHETLVGDAGEIYDEVLWVRTLNHGESLSHFTCFSIHFFRQIIPEEVDIRRSFLVLITNSNQLDALFILHLYCVD